MICLEKQNVKKKSLDCGCKISVHTKCHSKWNILHPNKCIICRRNSNLTQEVPVQEAPPNLGRNNLTQEEPVQEVPPNPRPNYTVKKKIYLSIVMILTIILFAVMVV